MQVADFPKFLQLYSEKFEKSQIFEYFVPK